MTEHEKLPRSYGTHDGPFHADEVTACALLLVFDRIDRDKIVRTRDFKQLQHCAYVCDVGGVYAPDEHLFDHHQADYRGELSSAGMVLTYLHDENLIDDKLYASLNSTLIKGVDDHDNGCAPQIKGLCTYSDVIAEFTPIDYDATPREQNAAFFQALAFATDFLQRKLDRFHYIRSCRASVVRAMEKGEECLFFEKAIPWMDAFFECGGLTHPAHYIIMPTGSHWKLRGIPPSLEKRMEVRLPLPKAWAGLLDDDLKAVTGIPGAIFCHKGRFISVWETRDDALHALSLVLNQKKEPL